MVIGVSLGIGVTSSGLSLSQGLVVGLVLVCLIGIGNGILIAYAEIPAIFTTLAMGSIVYGVGRSWFPLDVMYVPGGNPWVGFIGQGALFDLPVPIFAFAALALIVHLLLKHTRFGRFIYATGDNPISARTVGVPTRVVIVAQYVISSLIAYGAGIILMALVSSVNTKLYNSTLVYDVLLVVVLGGIGLNGGRGGVRNILVGTGLVGILVNGMTIMSLSYTAQNLVKSIILLAAILIDSLINPRDEQTSQHGDI
jgi:ribose transport system permease protein